MDDVSASCTALTIEYQYTYNAVGVNVRDICRNTRCTTDIVQRKRGNIRVELEQERKRLANASARAEHCDLGVGARRRAECTGRRRGSTEGVAGEHGGRGSGESYERSSPSRSRRVGTSTSALARA